MVANVTNEATYPLADDSDALPDLFAEDSDTPEHEHVGSWYIKEDDNSYNYEQYHYYKCDVCKKMIAEEHTWCNDYVDCAVIGEVKGNSLKILNGDDTIVDLAVKDLDEAYHGVIEQYMA